MRDEQVPVTDMAWAHRSSPAMGSTAELLVWGPKPEPLAAWAMYEIERLEACWSRFRPTSELSLLNARAGEGPRRVSPLLWDALVAARQAHGESEGWFDPTVLRSLVALGYDRSYPFSSSPCGEPNGVPVPVPGFASIAFDESTHEVDLPRGCGIDLGGIGKGLAADRVVEGLLLRGATSACVSMGGDVRVAGPGPDLDDAWEIRVEDPRDDRCVFRFPLVDEALAQSSVLYRRWRHGSREVHHLVDPRTGDASTSGVVCAVVSARETWRAESLAKSALLAGVREGLALLARAEVDGWLLDDAGATHATADVADVTWRDESSLLRLD